jgi:hypothetical protein
VNWVDAGEGDEEKPEHKRRLLANEIKRDKRKDLFAATPPLEAKKMLFSLLASMPGSRLNFGDVVRAYFHAKARRKVYVDLPAEDFEEGVRGRLRKAMCGARDAAQNWEMECAEMMLEAKFEKGAYSACVFYRTGRTGESWSTATTLRCWDPVRAWTGSEELSSKERRSSSRSG